MEQVLSAEVLIQLNTAGATTATSAIDGTAVDMQGYDAVCFFVKIATANAGNFLKASQSDDAAGSPDGFSDLEGSKTIVDTDGDIAILDIRKPLKRYVKPHVIRAGATTVTGDLYCIRYNSRKSNQVNDVADLQNLVRLISPAEGTA